MKKSLIILCVILLIGLIIGITMINKGNKKKLNQIETQTVNGIEFSNAKLEYENDLSNFSVVVTNKTDKPVTLNIIDIVFEDAKGNEIITLKGLVDRSLDPNKSAVINAQVSMDIRNYKKIIYKF